MTIGRVANLSKAAEEQLGVGRAPCHVPQPLLAGAVRSAPTSARSLPPFRGGEDGPAHTAAGFRRHEITYDDSTQRATGVRVRDA